MIDVLIVGQGLSGTWLSYYLNKAGSKVIVIDEDKPYTASKVASGIINPVTGRRIVRTWRIEELLPFSTEAYSLIGDELGVKLVRKCAVLDFHPDQQMKEAFSKRLNEETEYLHEVDKTNWEEYFHFFFGVGSVAPCLLIDINNLLAAWRKNLISKHQLLNEHFDHQQLEVKSNGVRYKNFEAKKVIFCDGVNSVDNPYFKNLPFAPNKGEALIVKIKGLPYSHIYKQGISIVPLKDDLFWVGSTYQWNFENDKPTAEFKERMLKQLHNWLKLPFKVIDHLASVRPANVERRPFVGLHPTIEQVGILNGMGTKGCSLAPFFANQLADHLANGSAIYPDADVRRFTKVLARDLKG